MQTEIRPFSSGSQFDTWASSNCFRCNFSRFNGGGCDIEGELIDALFGSGTVDMDTALRMGRLEHPKKYNWPCGEVEWTAEWMAQCDKEEVQGAEGK